MTNLLRRRISSSAENPPTEQDDIPLLHHTSYNSIMVDSSQEQAAAAAPASTRPTLGARSYQRCEVSPAQNGKTDDDEEKKASDNGHEYNTTLNDDDNDDDAASIASSTRSSSSSERRYNWRLYVPSTGKFSHYFRWLMVGGGALAAEKTDEEILKDLSGLARCLTLLRKYLDFYGMPEKGGVRDQEYVLREVVRDLYAGGAPLWALEPVMQKAGEGLTVRNDFYIILICSICLAVFFI
jgi:hypothetical protein